MTVLDEIAAHRDDGPVAAAVRPRVPLPPLALAAVVLAASAGFVGVATAAPAAGVVAAGVATCLLGLLRPSGTRGARTAWTLPPALRAWEYAAAVALGAHADPVTGAATAFAYVLAVGYHHYDVVYRLRHRGVAPDRWVGRALGGWELRVAVLLAARAVGEVVVALGVLAAWCGLLAVAESIRFWVGGTGDPDLVAPTDAEELE